MDGLAAVTARIQQIEAMIGAPRTVAPPVAAATTTSVAVASGQADFATVLAAQTGAAGVAASAAAARTASAPDPHLTPEQRANAEAIVAAGRDMGLSLRDQAIGVMTAMGESSLRVIDHGDKAGPDSRGLFQQRDNGAWGTYADRMDPTRSSQSLGLLHG